MKQQATFLPLWIGCLALTGLLVLAYPATAESPKLTIKKTDEGRQVMIDGKLFAGYNTKGQNKPFLYPIIGPTGANMTRHYPMKQGVKSESKDHPHHTSLWFAHGGVNGIDYWHNKSKEPMVQAKTTVGLGNIADGRAKICTSDVWLNKERTALANASIEYGFEVLEDGSRVIDYTTGISPDERVGELVFADTKEGTMAIRTHPALRLKGEAATGKAINSEGHKERAVWGKRAKWVAYWGIIDGKTCGIAIFDHPTNLRHPTWWHARDYGLIAANPFGISDFERGKHKRGAGNHTVKQGESLKLSYRFVFFAGTPEEAKIGEKYDQWVKETTK